MLSDIFCRRMVCALWEGQMTTTKIVYVLAAIVPFGCVFLALALLARKVIIQQRAAAEACLAA